MFVKKKKKKKKKKISSASPQIWCPGRSVLQALIFNSLGWTPLPRWKLSTPPPSGIVCLFIDWGRVRLGCIFYEIKYLGLRTEVLMQCSLKFIRAVLMTWRITFSSLETASTPENNLGGKNTIIYIIKHEAKFTVKLYQKTPGQIIPFPKWCYTYIEILECITFTAKHLTYISAFFMLHDKWLYINKGLL